MEKIKIAYDDNLGLPKDFANFIQCETLPYHDLKEMLTGFEQQAFSAMFAPAGTLPYLHDYELIAQSVFAPTNTLSLKTIFVSTKKIKIEEINNQLLGRVNEYCTTSFMAPLIYLMKYYPAGTNLRFKNTNGFSDMLHRTAEGQLDCSMVWDIILDQHPQDANKVNAMFDKNDLPAPLMIAAPDFPAELKEKIQNFKSQDKAAFFNGFQDVKYESVKLFTDAAGKALSHFKIDLEP